MKLHPLCEIFPPMKESEYEGLVESIKDHGLQFPITLFNEQVLDGKERLRACIEAGIDPEFEYYKGDDPLGFVISKNLTRAHYSKSQLAMAMAKLCNAHGASE